MRNKITGTAFTVFILLTLTVYMSCKGARPPLQEKKALDVVARERLGKKYEVTYNDSKTFALCQQQREGDHAGRTFQYIVVQLSDNQVVVDGSFKMGYAKWHNNTSIEVVSSASIHDEPGQKKIIPIPSNRQ